MTTETIRILAPASYRRRDGKPGTCRALFFGHDDRSKQEVVIYRRPTEMMPHVASLSAFALEWALMEAAIPQPEERTVPA